MDFFVRAKHWQIFMLFVGAPIVYYIIVMYIIRTIKSFGNPLYLDYVMYTYPLFAIVFFGVTFYGLYALSVRLQPNANLYFKIDAAIYNVFLLMPFLYSVVMSFMIAYFVINYRQIVIDGKTSGFNIIMSKMRTVFWFALLSVAYCIWIIAKAIKSIEMKQNAKASEVIDYFLQLLLFPIGIWLIQPRINKIFAAEPEPETINIPEGYL